MARRRRRELRISRRGKFRIAYGFRGELIVIYGAPEDFYHGTAN